MYGNTGLAGIIAEYNLQILLWFAITGVTTYHTVHYTCIAFNQLVSTGFPINSSGSCLTDMACNRAAPRQTSKESDGHRDATQITANGCSVLPGFKLHVNDGIFHSQNLF